MEPIEGHLALHAPLAPRTTPTANGGYGAKLPLEAFLDQCHARFRDNLEGRPADYIPELSTADPAAFGICAATIDGHVYAVGDSATPFTIQSVSKAFVFALALELAGQARVEGAIGVEPSGEAFNSIRLTNDNRPFNPMVNAGAIACSGLIHEIEGPGAFDRIRRALGAFAGRDLGFDEKVFASETATGDRNRAIAWLLRNYGVIKGDVDEVLDVYFRQCSVLVTARDLAVMAATLANRGVNPVTNQQVVSPHVVALTLSVMTSSGMYDYAGEWIYRVGIPAKSGVGGGIMAALPSQLGLGTFSPNLDSHGNSVRGLQVCEALSAHFDLHMLNRNADVRTCIAADYDVSQVTSRRSRAREEQALLEAHASEIRVVELVGALNFATIDYVTRRLAGRGAAAPLLVLDFRRVPDITLAGARLLGQFLGELEAARTTTVLSGLEPGSRLAGILKETLRLTALRQFPSLDECIEWAEDQVIYRYGGFSTAPAPAALADQALLDGLTGEQVAQLATLATARRFAVGDVIVQEGAPADSIFFLLTGMVSVKLPTGTRLASLSQGMAFGEMGLLEARRSASVVADTRVTCLELRLQDFEDYCRVHPQVGGLVLRNLAQLLATRLRLANAKIDLLTNFRFAQTGP
jgi:glutaminase